MNKKQVAAIALALYLTIVVIVMLLSLRFDLEIFFVLALIGLLVIVELIQHQYARPQYQQYLNYLMGAGIVIFGIIVVRKIIEILAE